MPLVVPSATGGLPSIASDPMADTLESDQLFGVDIDHVTWLLSLVAHDWLFRLEVVESTQPQPVQHTTNNR
jgi:hypothetical protein